MPSTAPPAVSTAPPVVKVAPQVEAVQLGCAARCVLQGISATCEARIQWAADNIYHSDPTPCMAAHHLVKEECTSCASCRLSDLRCNPPPPPCSVLCTLHGHAAPCADRVLWVAEHVHRGSSDPCGASHKMVLGECPVCHRCELKETSCKAAPPQQPLLIKLRFDGSGVPLGSGPWRTLGHFIQKRCFWKHPAWSAYVKLHQRILLGHEPPRYLVFRRDTMGQGVGATLRGLYLCFYLAMAAGRALLIDWETPVELKDVFEPGEFDWRWKVRRDAVMRLASSKRVSYVNLEQNEANQDVLWKSVNSKVQAVFLETNMDATAWFDRLGFDSLGIYQLRLRQLVREYTRLSGCAFHSLFRFREKGSFAGLWRRSEETVPAGPRIGVHLRVGDVSWSADSTDRRPVIFDKEWGLGTPERAAKQIVECAQQTARQVGLQPPCTIIFESDNDGSKKAAKKSCKESGPCTCWTSSARPTHERRTLVTHNTRETWTALVMLSSVEILISSQSTFSFTAGSIGPGLVEPRRHVDFEAALKRRLYQKRPKDDMRDLCRFE